MVWFRQARGIRPSALGLWELSLKPRWEWALPRHVILLMLWAEHHQEELNRLQRAGFLVRFEDHLKASPLNLFEQAPLLWVQQESRLDPQFLQSTQAL